MKLACANVARITRYAAVARHVVLQAGCTPKSSRSDTSGIQNPGGWLTTVVARVCLDMLRSRSSRREQPLGEPPGVHVPEPIVSR